MADNYLIASGVFSIIVLIVLGGMFKSDDESVGAGDSFIKTFKDISMWILILLIIYIMIRGKITRQTVILICGLIILVSIGIWLYGSYSKQIDQQNDPYSDWPADQYMETVGGQCPDYWDVLDRDEKGNPICVNRFGVPVVPRVNKNGETYDKCFDSDSTTQKTFKTLVWPENPDELASSDRCKWVKNCGPSQGARASWLGIDQSC